MPQGNLRAVPEISEEIQKGTKMKIDFASRCVKSALLQTLFPSTFKEPWRRNSEHVQSEERNTPKLFLTVEE
jgi:hypothetical protein